MPVHKTNYFVSPALCHCQGRLQHNPAHPGAPAVEVGARHIPLRVTPSGRIRV